MSHFSRLLAHGCGERSNSGLVRMDFLCSEFRYPPSGMLNVERWSTLTVWADLFVTRGHRSTFSGDIVVAVLNDSELHIEYCSKRIKHVKDNLKELERYFANT
jgi:hypothetical protein